jgi:hypothetical protein
VVEHVQESGEELADAAWIRSVPACWRKRELCRLERVYGAGYRWNVERHLRSSGAMVGNSEGNPRETALNKARQALDSKIRG